MAPVDGSQMPEAGRRESAGTGPARLPAVASPTAELPETSNGPLTEAEVSLGASLATPDPDPEHPASDATSTQAAISFVVMRGPPSRLSSV
jgi:hypothetical protein